MAMGSEHGHQTTELTHGSSTGGWGESAKDDNKLPIQSVCGAGGLGPGRRTHCGWEGHGPFCLDHVEFGVPGDNLHLKTD